jgi:predicted Rossmann-fold nucleotide-binding protein
VAYNENHGGILNIDGYYDQLLSLFDHAVDEQFAKPVHRRMVLSASRPESLVIHLLGYQPPLVEKMDRPKTDLNRVHGITERDTP